MPAENPSVYTFIYAPISYHVLRISIHTEILADKFQLYNFTTKIAVYTFVAAHTFADAF